MIDRKLILLVAVMLVPAVSAVSINGYDTYQRGVPEDIFQNLETVTFQVNASNSSSATVDVTDSSGNTVVDGGSMAQVGNGTYQVYQYNHSIASSDSGYWSYSLSVSDGNNSVQGTGQFFVATDDPAFVNQSREPGYLKEGTNVTVKATLADSASNIQTVNITFNDSTKEFRMNLVNSSGVLSFWRKEIETWRSGAEDYMINVEDSSGNTAQARNGFTVYGEAEKTNVSVKIAPSCSTTLDYYLLPGDGEIVQNKTGVFVEIASNSGNVESNITVDYLDVTYEADDPYSSGEPKGPVVRSYQGEKYPYVPIGEDITYFKLFHATYQLGNYTGHSSISTRCMASGANNQNYQKTTLNQSYKCSDPLNSSTFSCHNFSVVDTNLVTAETVNVNMTATTSKTVDEQVSGTEAYTGNGTLNATLYNFYSFNSSSTGGYDYACATPNSSIEDDTECAFETGRIPEYNIKVQDLGYDGQNGTFSLMKYNNDYLNTSLDCESQDNTTALCNSTLRFYESFSFYGNFEIVKGIGEEAGGVNESGNETTNQTIPGNNDEPGQTEVPEPTPTPVPTPVPEPTPEVSVEITPHQKLYRTKQGLYVAATFNATNLGNVPVENVSLVPQINKFREGWNVRNAQIANLSVNETVVRDVFVQPPEDAAPGTYVVPVSAEVEDRQLDLDYFQLKVLRAEFIPRISIEESPRAINVPVNTNQSFPVLVENVGKTNITGVEARIQNIDDCGAASSERIEILDVNESRSLQLDVSAAGNTARCNATLVVSSQEGAYAFSRLQVTIIPEQGLIPQEQRVPLIAILWTLLLAAYAFFTRRMDLESNLVRIPFLIIILGEAFIILYTVVNYYALPIASVLPF
ncbi:MAG: NEW3 domain-containing protein [Candidatus Nanohaloarchaea archaeon]